MNILIHPIVTEKVSAMNENGRYGFMVDIAANKIQIRTEVEKLYSVKVKKVNTIRLMGKKKVKFTKSGTIVGRKPNYKKALVTLMPGEVIDFYGNV